jgi:hypothetical protein
VVAWLGRAWRGPAAADGVSDVVADRPRLDRHARRKRRPREKVGGRSVRRRPPFGSSPRGCRVEPPCSPPVKKNFSGNLGTASERGAVTKRRPKRGTADGA